MKLTILDESLLLDATGALYWPQKKALLLADTHLGKVTHFRKHGFAVPRAPIFDFYQKMEGLKRKYDFNHLYFLGDLFHSSLNREWSNFQEWSQSQAYAMTLVSGNHDILPSSAYEKTPLEVVKTLQVGSFVLTHHPEEEHHFNICGHVHPGILLKGKGRQRLKVSCFFHRPHQLILPAFGAFTGLHFLELGPQDKVYILGDQEVYPHPH